MRTIVYPLAFFPAAAYASIDVLSQIPSLYAPHTLSTSGVGEIFLGGSFDGVSKLEYDGQAAMLQSGDSGQDGVIAQFNVSGTDVFLKQVFANGQIAKQCGFSDGYSYLIAGNFTSILNVSVPNGLATVNFSSGDVSAISANGSSSINGTQVNAVLCNQTTAYLGGSFSFNGSTGVAVYNLTDNSLSLPAFGGFVANSTINAISALNSSIVFGGNFAGLAPPETGLNGTNSQPGVQPVSLNLANATGFGSANANGVDANGVLCANGAGSGWTADLDSTTGFLNLSLAYTALPTKLRLYNLPDGSGTKAFRVISQPAGSFMNLTYTDGNTGQQQSCAAYCPLPESSDSIRFTDFEFVNVVPTTSLRIELLDFYGSQAGLRALQLFEQGLRAFAYDALNSPRACNGANASAPAVSELSGNGWSVSGDYMVTKITDRAALPNTYAQFSPNIDLGFGQRGAQYEVRVYTPGCNDTMSCLQRGMVNVTVFPGFGQPASTLLYQTNEALKYDLVYNGTLKPGAYVRITPTNSNELPMELVAFEASFNYLGGAPNYNATNLFEYLPTNFTDGRVSLPVGNTSLNLFGLQTPTNCSINAVLNTNDTTLIGGSNINGSNFAVIGPQQLDFAGVEGAVEQLRLVNGSLLAVSSTDTYILSNSNAVPLEINQPVSSITPFSLNGSMYWAISTSANSLYLWDPTTNQLATEDVQGRVKGSLSGTFALQNATLYTGDLLVFGKASPGGIAAVGGNARSSAPYTLLNSSTDTSTPSRIIGGCYLTTSDFLLYGDFKAKLSDNQTEAQNAIIVHNGTTSSQFFSPSSNYTVLAVAARNGLAAVGGQFSTTLNGTSVQNLAFYNISTAQFDADNQPEVPEGTFSDVQALAFQPNLSALVVAGNFNFNAKNGTCSGLCIYNTASREWLAPTNSTAPSNVFSLLFVNQTRLLAANSSAVYTLDIGNGQLRELPPLPGTLNDIVVVSNSSDSQSYAITGSQTNGSPFVAVLEDSGSGSWEVLENNPVLAGSNVHALSVLSGSGQQSSKVLNGKSLLVSGDLVFNGTTGISLASFDGQQWAPVYGTSGADGKPGTIRTVFSQLGGALKGALYGNVIKPPSTPTSQPAAPSSSTAPQTATPKPHREMPVGHVVGIACGIGIGCVLVLSMLYLLVELLFKLAEPEARYTLLPPKDVKEKK